MLWASDIRTLGLWALLGFCTVDCAGSHAGDPPATPPAPVPKVAAEDREVAFQSADLKLVGTLSLPERTSGTRTPAVVLIGGSGALSRDESVSGQLGMGFGFSIPVFRLLAEELRAHGIAVLRYDKRSCGPFNSCARNDYPLPSANVVVEDFERDVTSAVDYLKALPEIDATRVSIIGHSEGAAFVIAILTERADIASGVMISAPFQPIDRILHDQTEFLRQLLGQTGASEAKIAASLAPLLTAQSAVAEVRAGTYAGGAIMGAYAPYWASLMALGDKNPSQSLALDRAVLAIGGSYDWNVPASELTSWQSNFQAASHPEKRSTQLLECMTHALNCVSQPDPLQIKPSDIGSTLQADLLNAIAQFVENH